MKVHVADDLLQAAEELLRPDPVLAHQSLDVGGRQIPDARQIQACLLDHQERPSACALDAWVLGHRRIGLTPEHRGVGLLLEAFDQRLVYRAGFLHLRRMCRLALQSSAAVEELCKRAVDLFEASPYGGPVEQVESASWVLPGQLLSRLLLVLPHLSPRLRLA